MEIGQLHCWSELIFSFRDLTLKWRNVHLTELQDESPCDRILSNHAELKSGREDVRGRTKAFSQLDNSSKLDEFGTLLRSYQGYIDCLTGYLKEAERTYIELFSKIRCIPDPYPLMRRLSREMDSVPKFIKRSVESDDLRVRIHELQMELEGFGENESTIHWLREQLAEAHGNASAKVGHDVMEVTAEHQSLLLQYQQHEHEMQQEIHRLQTVVFEKDLGLRDLTEQLDALRTSLDGAEMQRSRDVTELTAELEATQNLLAKREAELRRLCCVVSHTETPGDSEVPRLGGTESPLPAWETPSRHSTAVLSSSSNGATPMNVAAERMGESRGDTIAEVQRVAQRREESLLAELTALQRRSGEQKQRDEAQRREAEQGMQELQARLRSLGTYVEQLRVEKTQLAEAVRLLEVELHSCSNKPSNRLKLLRQHEEQKLHKPHQQQGQRHPIISTTERDTYTFEKLMSSAPAWNGSDMGRKEDGTNTKATLSCTSTEAWLSVETERDPFFIVAAQRDALRARLMTLSEVSSEQIQSLRLDLANLSSANHVLRQRLASCTSDHINLGNAGESGLDVVSLIPSGKDDGLRAKSSIPLWVDPATGVLSHRTVLNAVDYYTSLMLMRVCATAARRRVFVLYFLAFHLYRLLCFVV